MKTTKKIIAWLHLWLGLVVGLLFSLAAITGSILVFEKELDPLLYHSFYYIDEPVSPTSKYLPLDSLVSQAKLYAQGKSVHSLLIPANPSSGQNILFQTEGTRLERVLLAINPYTGQLERKIAGNRHLFTLVEDLHRELLMGKTGKTITGICCLSYLTILLSGLVLWWPKNQKILRQRLKIKWDAKFKRLNWDLHAVGGFYTLPILFIIAFTGLTWSYKWFNDSIFYLFDGKGPQKLAKYYPFSESFSPQEGPLQKAYSQTQQLLPYTADVTITLPGKELNVVSISKEQPQAAVSNVVDRLLFSAQSGELVKKELYESQSKGMKVRRLIFPIHTGSIYGLPTKLLAFLCCLIGASMPITGFIIWLKRKKKTKKVIIKPRVSSEQPVLP
ncbi:MAG TPA: PepSY-associated TM helix domain-containing protein [Pseudosphingobacterium sp.]|nr:PepSY-associated TM helix domain-containing protein [Pseudosphingobacterium sp.]